MKRTETTEYNDGFRNGAESFTRPPHISAPAWDRMIADNYRKAETPHDSPLIAAYWRGWIDGRNALPVAG
jgi:hypothetical protein